MYLTVNSNIQIQGTALPTFENDISITLLFLLLLLLLS